MLRQALLAATVSGVALLSAGAVSAQTAPNTQTVPAAAEPAGVDDIVVTAQRRSENIRDVPFAVTALSPQTLQEVSAGGADILSLSGRVPSLQVESSNGRYAPRFYIRGLGNVDFDFTASQPVSVVLDNVVLESVYLKGFPLFDVQQLEVLRGPQGTLVRPQHPGWGGQDRHRQAVGRIHRIRLADLWQPGFDARRGRRHPAGVGHASGARRPSCGTTATTG